jgi:hypothetical protein
MGIASSIEREREEHLCYQLVFLLYYELFFRSSCKIAPEHPQKYLSPKALSE